MIQPHLPVRLPCYDFTPLAEHTFGASLVVEIGCQKSDPLFRLLFLLSKVFSDLLLLTSDLYYVRTATSGASDSVGVTGGVYKARERIHRSMLTCDY